MLVLKIYLSTTALPQAGRARVSRSRTTTLASFGEVVAGRAVARDTHRPIVTIKMFLIFVERLKGAKEVI